MKVSRWYSNKDIRLEEIPTPRPGPGEMLVKVLSCGICGSDVVEWYRLPRAPLIQGHEIGAEVAEVGESVKHYRPGDRVFVAPKVPCMKCRYCGNGNYPACSNVAERLPGGFAEYILVPEVLVARGTYRLPENVSFDQSTFIEPLACVIRAQKLAGIKETRSVMVMGCGMSGLLHIKLAGKSSCRIVATDVNRTRLEFARRAGAETLIDAGDNVPERLISATGKKADVVVLCTSAVSAVNQAWKCVDKGGSIVFFAVPGPDKQVAVPINDFWTQEIRILTSYYCGPPDIVSAMQLIADGTVRVEDLITHRLPLKDTARGFEMVLRGQESIKVIIKPNE